MWIFTEGGTPSETSGGGGIKKRRAAGIHDENILGQGCLYCRLAFALPSTAAADKLSIHQDLGSRCSRPGLVFLPLHSAGQIKSLRLGVHSAGQIKPLRLGESVLQTSLCAPPCTHMSTCLFKQPTPGTSSETVVAVAKKKKKKKKELLASMTRTYWMWYTRSWWIFVSASRRALCSPPVLCNSHLSSPLNCTSC